MTRTGHHHYGLAEMLRSRIGGLGDRIDGWRVCWVGGWDRGKVLFVVMVNRSLYMTQQVL
jgi:hypothetical protein